MTEPNESGEVPEPEETSEAGSLTDVPSERVTEETSERIAVRATVHLPGLPVGAVVFVDPSDPQIEGYLEGKFLVRVSNGDESRN